MKAHCDTKLKKAKAASGILMIRQNSFHEILSLLSILILIPPSPVKQQHLCQPVYLFLHLPASDPIIWLLSVCLSLCFCAAHTTFLPLRRGSTRKQEWKFQIGSRDWTGKVGKGGKRWQSGQWVLWAEFVCYIYPQTLPANWQFFSFCVLVSYFVKHVVVLVCWSACLFVYQCLYSISLSVSSLWHCKVSFLCWPFANEWTAANKGPALSTSL